MSTADERLVVLLEARISDFERNMRKASQTSGSAWKKIEKDSATSASRMQQSLSAATIGITKGLAGMAGIGALGITGVVAGIRQAVTEIAEMSAEAKRAGVGVEVFQELKYGAEQSRISVDALTDGLKEMQLRADEFITTGAGSGAEAFQRLGYTAGDLAVRLKDPAQMLNNVMERVRELDKASQIRVLDEIFGGTGGEQFIRYLDRGRNSVEMMRKEARETGAVLDAEMVKRAEEIDRRFQALANTIGTNVKGAVISLIDALRTMGTEFHTAMQHVADAPKVALDKTDQELAGMRAQLATHQATRNYAVIGDLEKRIAEVQKKRDALAEAVRETTRGASASNRDGAPPTGDAPLPTPRPQGIAGKGDTSNIKTAGDTAKKGYDDLRQAAQARLMDLQTEQNALGMTTQAAEAYRFKQQAIAEAQRMQITLTPQQLQELDALATQYGQVSSAIEQAGLKQQHANELQREIGSLATSTFSGLVKGTETWDSALAKVADRLTDLVLQAALLGDGPLSGLFGGSSSGGGKMGGLIGMIGGLFGFAEGGSVRGPGTGTSDSILARVSNGEFIVRAEAARRHAPLLAAINSGEPMPRFAAGGYVGEAPTLPVAAVPSFQATAGAMGGGQMAMNFAPNITVNASGGSPEQNDDLAARIGKQVEDVARATVVAEMRKQMRPGGMIGR